MLKKTIEYEDYNGVLAVEDFYFNLTKAELIQLETSMDGGMADFFKRIVASNNQREIMSSFEMIIKAAYGVRSEDGKRFTKSPELFQAFKESPAYSEFFVELVTDAGAAAAFVRAVIPTSNDAKVSEALSKVLSADTSDKATETLMAMLEQVDEKPTDPSHMSREELVEALKAKNAQRTANTN